MTAWTVLETWGRLVWVCLQLSVHEDQFIKWIVQLIFSDAPQTIFWNTCASSSKEPSKGRESVVQANAEISPLTCYEASSVFQEELEALEILSLVFQMNFWKN